MAYVKYKMHIRYIGLINQGLINMLIFSMQDTPTSHPLPVVSLRMPSAVRFRYPPGVLDGPSRKRWALIS